MTQPGDNRLADVLAGIPTAAAAAVIVAATFGMGVAAVILWIHAGIMAGMVVGILAEAV